MIIILKKDMVIDIDKILLEWSYRCDKGYPDLKSQKDMAVLQEVLNEMGIETPFDVNLTETITEVAPVVATAPKTPVKKSAPTPKPAVELTPAEPLMEKTSITLPKNFTVLYKAMREAGKAERMERFIDSLPGKTIQEYVIDQLDRLCSSKTNIVELVKSFKMHKKLDDITKVNMSTGIFADLYKIQPKGTGPGEVLISWVIENAVMQGGTVSYDIDYQGQHWEVKSLIDPDSNVPNSIDPAKYGKMSNWKLSKLFSRFFENVINPYYDHGLRDDILDVFNDYPEIKRRVTEALDVLETIPQTTADGTTNLEFSGEVTSNILNTFYLGITKMNSLLLPKVRVKKDNKVAAAEGFEYDELTSITESFMLTERDVKTPPSIRVKSNAINANYWISADDVDTIVKNAGKNREVSIKVGKKIMEPGKEGKIWITNLLHNPFIQNPKMFVDSLKEIRDGFMAGKDGLIYLTKGQFHISKGMNDFFTSNMTRSTYRFSLKALNKYQNLQIQKEQ